MIEIIKNPNPVIRDKYKAICDNCGCEFSYQQEDIINDWNGVLGPGSYGGKHVICPNCGERVSTYPREENKTK